MAATDDRPFAAEAECVRPLMLAAGQLAQKLAQTDLAVEYKEQDGRSPVTIADRQINAFLMRELAARFALDGFSAEEDSSTHAYASRQHSRRVWCIDPIDGTREYIAGSGQYAVMVGLAIDGLPRFGAVYEPAHDRLFMGACSLDDARLAPKHDAAGERWASCEHGQVVTALAVSETATTERARLMVSRHQRSRALEAICRRLRVSARLPLGSVGLKMARIAAGEGELYACMTDRIHAWDACGPAAIVLAAGGRASDLAGRPLACNEPSTAMAHGLFASNRALFRPGLQALEEAGRELPNLGRLQHGA